MKCIVIANKEDFELVGIDRDLTGQVVEYIKDYPTGYSKILVEPREDVLAVLGDRARKEEYDIPKSWLDFKTKIVE